MTETVNPKFCIECGQPLAAETKFCSECGTRQSDAGAATGATETPQPALRPPAAPTGVTPTPRNALTARVRQVLNTPEKMMGAILACLLLVWGISAAAQQSGEDNSASTSETSAVSINQELADCFASFTEVAPLVGRSDVSVAAQMIADSYGTQSPEYEWMTSGIIPEATMEAYEEGDFAGEALFLEEATEFCDSQYGS